MARSHLEIPSEIHSRDKRLLTKGHSSSLFSGSIHITAAHTLDYNNYLIPFTWQRQDRLHSHYFCQRTPGTFPCKFPAASCFQVALNRNPNWDTPSRVQNSCYFEYVPANHGYEETVRHLSIYCLCNYSYD